MSIREELTARLSAERGGVKLHEPFVAVVVKYLVESVGLTDANDFTDGDMKTTFEEAWASEKEGGTLPSMFSKRITQWLRQKDLSSVRPVDGRSDAGLEDDIEESEIFGHSAPTVEDVELLESDKKKQGLNGAQLIVLSAALELGRVPRAEPN